MLFIEEYGDLTEADEIQHVDARPEPWLHERGQYRDERYEVHYPVTLGDPREEPGYHDVIHTAVDRAAKTRAS